MRQVLLVCAVLFLGGTSVALGSDGHGTWDPPSWSPVFFAVLLLGIAMFPLLPTAHWWEHNRSKAKFGLVVSLPVAFLVFAEHADALVHAGIEYFQFLALIGALYVVAGGIHITGNLIATPAVNTLLIGIGYAIASLLGTTGASMIMLYPLLRTNKERSYRSHSVLFFILAVSNAGGLLTPLGDPPLFLGFLRGVPFLWFGQNLWWAWAICGVYLLVFYYIVDFYFVQKEPRRHWREDIAHEESLGVIGLANFVLLGGIIAATCFAPTPIRELCYLGCAVCSLAYSQNNHSARTARHRNNFSWIPIQEVAILFAAIFVTMIPALHMLQLHGSSLGVTEPWQYFLATGGFSSVLDNAPTYLIFQELGMATVGAETPALLAESAPHILRAISIGAVFMGANTYIGNAPNFMVKGVAEAQGVTMPNFFAYALYAIGILSPIYVLLCIVL